MDMNTRNNDALSSTELIYVGGIGFMFEVSQTLKHNLISPDILAFFDGVKESGKVTEDGAFPASIPLTNQRNSIFHDNGEDWIVCYDRIFRKCQLIKYQLKFAQTIREEIFYIDKSIDSERLAGVVTSNLFYIEK